MMAIRFSKPREKNAAQPGKMGSATARPAKKAPFWMFWKKGSGQPAKPLQKKRQVAASRPPGQPDIRRHKKNAAQPGKMGNATARPAKKTPFWMFWKKGSGQPAKPLQKKRQVAASRPPGQPDTLNEKKNTPTPPSRHREEERAALIAEALDIHREGQAIWKDVDPGLREGLARMVRGAYGLTETEHPDQSPQEKPAKKSQPPDASPLTPPPDQRK